MPHTILYVEDNQLVLHAVKDTLEAEGWQVDVCEDGITGHAKIHSSTHYDLLLLDNELPGINGLELARQARRLAHRRATPIVMLSASDAMREARRAGANEFLRKPEGVHLIVETIARLLASSERG